MPFVLWHLLSMDAPTVAVCWTMFTASVTRTRLPWSMDAAMWLAVWSLYAADRLMDTRHLAMHGWEEVGRLESRHLFHHQHRQIFLVTIVVALVCLGILLPMLPVAALDLYATEGIFMAGYFVLIHWGRGSRKSQLLPQSGLSSRLSKELLVGPFFAAAVFIPTVSRRPELRWDLLPFAVLFAGLCSLNCLSIFSWEHSKPYVAPFGTGWAVRRLETLLWLFIGISLSMCLGPLQTGWWPFGFRLFALACAGGGAGLAGFHRFEVRLTKTTLRVAADACLLTPLLVFPFLRNP